MRFFFPLLFCVLCFSTAANANPVNVLSETHHVWGEIYDWPDHFSYDNNSQFHQSNSVGDINEEFLYAMSETSPFKVYAKSAGPQSGNAGAESIYIFNSGEGEVIFNYHGYVSNWDGVTVGYASISLFDLSINSELFFKEFTPPFTPEEEGPGISFDENLSVSLNLGSEYKLTLRAIAPSTEGVNDGTMTVGIYSDVSPVPEPSSILLFATGIIGFARVSLKRKKC